jgi:hydrogenase maturation protease
MSVSIIALGSDHGDDRVGFAALEALAERDVPQGCALHACANPATELLVLLADTEHAILVDAMVDGGSAGRVLRCAPGEFAARPAQASSHGLSVDSVLALASALGMLPATLTMVGVTIDSERDPYAEGLSPPVRAALPALVEHVLAAAAAEVAS